MAEPRNPLLSQFSGLMQKLSLSQKIILGAVTLGVFGGIIALISLVNRPSYATLFNNLAPQDAAKIVEKLKEKSIPYTLDDNGKSILVPKQQVYDMRLALAGEGLPQSSIIGYELFDRTNLGVSDFVQKINYRRALEGELARTILQLEEVEGARVHLVVPERALFKEDEKAATASVVLKLKSGRPMKAEAIKGITHLVASSIEGLDANNVTILDSRGVLLSDNSKSNSLASMTSTQYELQQKVEGYLGQKAQSLLENIVGPGNALVQVTAELDFRQVERTLEQYDPENTAIRSEQITEAKGGAGDSSSSASANTSTMTNYEVNKTVEHIVENMGNIRRLSVAAVVNGVPKTVERDGQKVTETAPRPQEEMDKLADLVRKAVGFNPQRSDELSVTNLAFGNSGAEQDFLYKQAPGTDWWKLGEKLFLVLAMLGGVFIIRSLLGRLRMRVEPGQMLGELAVAPATATLKAKRDTIQLSAIDADLPEEALLRSERRKQVAQYIQSKPAETSRLLKVWLAER